MKYRPRKSKAPVSRQQMRNITVRSVRRDVPDVQKLAKAIQRLAQYEIEHGKPYDRSEDQGKRNEAL